MTEVRDVYSRITGKIITDLEQGVRPWLKPWNAENAAGRIGRPLRHNGVPYKGINVVMLWSASVTKGYACPIWLTFKQAIELGGNVRKGETGELVVYANSFTRTETDDKGAEQEREIPFTAASMPPAIDGLTRPIPCASGGGRSPTACRTEISWSRRPMRC
jgi:antirestriction protein ArdC